MSLYSAREPGAAVSGTWRACLNQFVLIMGGLEQLDVGGQAGRVRQEHAEGDLAATRIF